jgi:ParB family chromosome partitioning protein
VESLQRVRCDLRDTLAGDCIAGDRDHPDLGVTDQRVTDVVPGSRQDVDDAWRQDVREDLGERERRERCPRRRLQHDRVAGRERWAELPRGHVQRVVPRRDRGDDADRVAPDDRCVAGCELVGREAIHDARGASEKAEQVHRRRHLVDRGTDRLAGIRALESTELVGLRLERVGDLEQQQRAILRGRPLPALERGLGRVHGAVDVLLRARWDIGDDLVVGRVHDFDRATVRRIDEIATDELLVCLGSFERLGHGCASWA